MEMAHDEMQLAYALEHLGIQTRPAGKFRELWLELLALLTKEQVRGLFQLKDDSGLISDFREEEA
jgi:hypothetical protein